MEEMKHELLAEKKKGFVIAREKKELDNLLNEEPDIEGERSKPGEINRSLSLLNNLVRIPVGYVFVSLFFYLLLNI